MKNAWKYALVLFGTILCASARAHAIDGVPEVDSNLAIGGITFLLGSLAVVRARLHK